MKRRSVQQAKRRDRKSGEKSYAGKVPFKYRWQAPWKKGKGQDNEK